VYNAAGKPLEGVYVDRNKDGKITLDDRYLFQKPDANYVLGFTSNLSYGDFNFGFVLRGNVGNYMYSQRNAGGTFGSNAQPYLYNPARNVLETGFVNSQVFSDYYLQNASFLKMDNLSFGYNLSKLLKTKFNVQATATVQNVLTITKYDGVDPEISGGIDNNIYLRPRTYSLGFNVNF
jgi:iron complex outermembrane receptor protein